MVVTITYAVSAVAEYDFVIKRLAPGATRGLSASYGGTSIQLSEYHEVNIPPAPSARKALFVSRDRPRFDLARNQKVGCCMTRRTAYDAYPVNEIVLARAALAPQVQQRTKVKEGRTRGRGVAQPFGVGRMRLVARFASHFELHRLLFFFCNFFYFCFFIFFFFFSRPFSPSLSPAPYLAVFRVSDFPSLLPFAKVVVR